MLTHSSCIKVVHPINSIALETKMNHLLKLWAIDKFPEADPCLIIRTWFAYPCLFSLGMQSGKEMECESTVWDRWWFAYDERWTNHMRRRGTHIQVNDSKFEYNGVWVNLTYSGRHMKSHLIILCCGVMLYQYQSLDSKQRQEKEVHGPSNTSSPLRTEIHLNVDVLIVTCYGQALRLQVLLPSIYYIPWLYIGSLWSLVSRLVWF